MQGVFRESNCDLQLHKSIGETQTMRMSCQVQEEKKGTKYGEEPGVAIHVRKFKSRHRQVL